MHARGFSPARSCFIQLSCLRYSVTSSSVACTDSHILRGKLPITVGLVKRFTLAVYKPINSTNIHNQHSLRVYCAYVHNVHSRLCPNSCSMHAVSLHSRSSYKDHTVIHARRIGFLQKTNNYTNAQCETSLEWC